MLTAYGAARCCSGGDGLQQTSQGVIVGRCRVGTPYLNEFGSVMKIHTDIQYNAQYKANVCLVFSSTAERWSHASIDMSTCVGVISDLPPPI